MTFVKIKVNQFPMPTKRCTEVREDGVYCGKDWSPQCIDEARCAAATHCFWRGFHMLADRKYRKKPETRT